METAGYDSSRPLAEQVAQRIKDYILEEKLKSGDKLPTETALAREMGVARSTVREAIKRLESQNILLHHKLNPLLHFPDIHQNTSSR